MEELLTVNDVAKTLKVSTDYVYDLISYGLLKVLKVGRMKVKRSEVERFIQFAEGKNLSGPYEMAKYATGEKR